MRILTFHARPVPWCCVLSLALVAIACSHAGERDGLQLGDDIRPPSALQGAEISQGEDDRSRTSPQLVNQGEVRRVLERAYSPELQDIEEETRTIFWLLVDESGQVEDFEIATSSGSAALDGAAARVVRAMRFEPGTVDGEPTPVWIPQPVTFRP